MVTELSIAQPMRAKTCYVCLSLRDLRRWDACADHLTFRSSGQSYGKPPVFSSQANLVLICRPTEGMNA
ncbi:hypothetical protein TNCV_347021 [Trichonephila clavipes]|nr:hypothetical protein TNCV_347021 [Trichonephila clavipes]